MIFLYWPFLAERQNKAAGQPEISLEKSMLAYTLERVPAQICCSDEAAPRVSGVEAGTC